MSEAKLPNGLDAAEFQRITEAATPGKRTVDEFEPRSIRGDDGLRMASTTYSLYPPSEVEARDAQAVANAAHIAACDRETTLALLAAWVRLPEAVAAQEREEEHGQAMDSAAHAALKDTGGTIPPMTNWGEAAFHLLPDHARSLYAALTAARQRIADLERALRDVDESSGELLEHIDSCDEDDLLALDGDPHPPSAMSVHADGLRTACRRANALLKAKEPVT